MPSQLAKLVQRLSREPHNIPPDRAARLSVRQILLALAKPDDDGEDDDPGVDLYDVHRRWAARNRVPDWYADELWRKRGGG